MTSKTSRIAAASILAIMLPLTQGTLAHAADRQASLVPVRSQADVVTKDITRASTHTSALPAETRSQVSSAIASAQAATTDALAAIHATDTADTWSMWSAQASLQDARTALDAASAELRYVTALVEGSDPQVTAALRALQRDIDVLRGVDGRG